MAGCHGIDSATSQHQTRPSPVLKGRWPSAASRRASPGIPLLNRSVSYASPSKTSTTHVRVHSITKSTRHISRMVGMKPSLGPRDLDVNGLLCLWQRKKQHSDILRQRGRRSGSLSGPANPWYSTRALPFRATRTASSAQILGPVHNPLV